MLIFYHLNVELIVLKIKKKIKICNKETENKKDLLNREYSHEKEKSVHTRQ